MIKKNQKNIEKGKHVSRLAIIELLLLVAIDT